MPKTPPDPAPTLSPAALQILAALAGDDLHGYGIIQAVAAQSEGRIRIGPGTLYDNLKRFLDQNWVGDVQPGPENDKRLYRLTETGRQVLLQEITRLERLVRDTKRFLQPVQPGRTE